jgi:transposase
MQLMLDLGADVDSRYIVVACAAQSWAPRKIANQRKAILAWLAELPAGSRLGMESTGGYHELLAELAHKAGFAVFVINPRDLRRYSEGLGRRGKTDRLDAEVIARYVAKEHGELHAYVPPTREQRALARLMRRRSKLVEIKGALKQTFRGVQGLQRQVKQLIERVDKLIEHIELLMQRALERMPAAQQAAQRIATIPGYGPLSSVCLAHRFTRVPYANSDAVVAATGLDPRPDESGKHKGRRRLSKCGPSEERRVLFNCARSASRMKLWRPYYETQRAKGLSPTAAHIVLARKMLRVAFAVYTQNSAFNPNRVHGIALQKP